MVVVEFSGIELFVSGLFEYHSPWSHVRRVESSRGPPSSSFLLIHNPASDYVAVRPHSVVSYRHMIPSHPLDSLVRHEIKIVGLGSLPQEVPS